MSRLRRTTGLPTARGWWWLLLLACVPGCSLGVMAGKMLKGDPLVSSQFKSMTGTDLSKGKHRIVVFCSTPASVNQDLSTLNLDLMDGLTRRMRLHGVDVVNPDKVAQWMDDNGGAPSDPSEMARAFDVDYVAWVDVFEFTFREDNSPKLLRGRARGFVRVYQVQEIDGDRTTLSAFSSEFTVTYPPHQPVSETGRSALLFQKEFVDRVCEELAEKFYDRPVAGKL